MINIFISLFRRRDFVTFNCFVGSFVYVSHPTDRQWKWPIKKSIGSSCIERHDSRKKTTNSCSIKTRKFFLFQYNFLALFVLSNSTDIKEILGYVEKLSPWNCFLLARWCIRHCLYSIARDLLEMVKNLVKLSIHRVWLESLIEICQAEQRLQTVINLNNDDFSELCDNLAEAGSHYESSLMQIPVCDHVNWFSINVFLLF